MRQVDPPLVAIVMPCLNEQDGLLSTCISLGFGAGSRVEGPCNAVLLLVDNGSSDNTVDVMAQVRSQSPPGRVVITHEPERGYVPPRHRGNETSRQLAREAGIPEDCVLVLQADADTQYSTGYVLAMTEHARAAGAGVLVEAAVDHTPEEKIRYRHYFAACETADEEIRAVLATEVDDVIVDDKACGYWLSDYTHWGGHRREYTQAGEEIHAETTRLYLRAKALGARRHHAEGAVAFHSARRLGEEAFAHIASAGFPREASWKHKWANLAPTTTELDALIVASPAFQAALNVRQQHALGLFSLLPQHANRALGRASEREWAPEWLRLLDVRGESDLIERPGQLIMDVLTLVDRCGAGFLALGDP